MLPSLIVSDLDGTLLDPDGRITPCTVAALEHAHRRGIPLAISTGRPVRWLADLRCIQHLRPAVICSNGAVRYDLASRTIVAATTLPVDISLTVAARMREALPEVGFGVEYSTSWGCEPDFSLHHRREAPDVVAALPELLARGAVKLLVVCDDLPSSRLADLLTPIARGLLEVTWSYDADHGLLEVGPPGVTKASALMALCRELGVDPGQAMAFGDMPNDRAMLRCVGHPVVMANGHPEMLREGFHIAPPNARDGVAHVLESVLSEA